MIRSGAVSWGVGQEGTVPWLPVLVLAACSFIGILHIWGVWLTAQTEELFPSYKILEAFG